MGLWKHPTSGKLLKNGSGALIDCETCPCGDPCDVCCFATLHVKITARTRVWTYDDPEDPDPFATTLVYDETTTAEVDIPRSVDDAGYVTPNCAFHNYVGYVYCDPETTQSVDPEAEGYCDDYGGGSLFAAASYAPVLEIPTGVLVELESLVTCEDGTPHGDNVCQFVLSQLNIYRKDGVPVEGGPPMTAAPFVLSLPLIVYFGYWSSTYHPFAAGYGPLGGSGLTVNWASFFNDGGVWDTLPFAPGIDPAAIESTTTEYWVELWQV